MTGSKSNRDLYAEITSTITADLEAGTLPWVRPWGQGRAPALALPSNYATGRTYSGINILLLWRAVIEHGFATHTWLTYKQAEALGAHVRRAERGTTIVYADRFTPAAERQRASKAGDLPGTVPFLKAFTVFNADQIDGLPAPLPSSPPLDDARIEPVVRDLIQASGLDFRIGGHDAFYDRVWDYVQVPPAAAFPQPVNWHRTALHEMAHATGHINRLNRDMTGAFGSDLYACEELVAELAAAFCCAALGIVPTVRHADYLASWLKVIRADKRAIIRAASKAAKAADWLLRFAPEGSDRSQRPAGEKEKAAFIGAFAGPEESRGTSTHLPTGADHAH